MNITFQKASTSYTDTFFSWLAELHMMKFWDNSQEYKDDVLNFIQGKPQTYALFIFVSSTALRTFLKNAYFFIFSERNGRANSLDLMTKAGRSSGVTQLIVISKSPSFKTMQGSIVFCHQEPAR